MIRPPVRLESAGDQNPDSRPGSGVQRRRSAGVDVPGSQWRQLRRSPRLSGWGGGPRPPRNAVLLRLRRPDPGLPAALHLPALRGAGVLPADQAPFCRGGTGLAARHHRRALRRGAGQPAADRGGERARGDALDCGRHLDRAAAQHFRLRPGQRHPGAGSAVGGLQHPVVGLGPAGGSGRRYQADPGHDRCVPGRGAALGGRGLRRGGFRRHGGGLGRGDRAAGPVLLHRPARRCQPGGPDRDVVQPVLARWHLADPRPRRRLRAACAGRDRGERGAGGAGVAGTLR